MNGVIDGPVVRIEAECCCRRFHADLGTALRIVRGVDGEEIFDVAGRLPRRHDARLIRGEGRLDARLFQVRPHDIREGASTFQMFSQSSQRGQIAVLLGLHQFLDLIFLREARRHVQLDCAIDLQLTIPCQQHESALLYESLDPLHYFGIQVSDRGQDQRLVMGR